MLVAVLCSTYSFGQKKKPAKPVQEPTPDLIERTPVRQPKKDTVEIIYETVPAKQAKKQENDKGSLLSVKEEVITIPKKDTNRRKNVQIVYDTVKYVKKPKPDENQQGAEDKVKAPTAPAVADNKTGKETKEVKETEKPKEGLCGCVSLAIKAQETINYEDYINYTFTFKNNCKTEVYVYSYAFRFTVTDYFGKPVKRLRRIDFVKRFDHSEYERIDPGETYEYRFADDPFFEYELMRGSQYRFAFMHSNATNKSKIAPGKTYLCNEYKEQVVTVK